MTTIVCDTLETTLTQTVNFKYYRRYHIEGIKVRLVMYNSPAGTFTLSFKSGATTLQTKNFSAADIKTDLGTSDDYAYIDKAIVFDTPVIVKNGSYDLVLSHSGYTESPTSFLGWVKSHENIFNELESAPVDYTYNPFDVLIYEKVREDIIR